MLVHAHPDDESSGTGATMARYAAEGAGVTLVTCTLGEMGDVVAPELEHLRYDRDDALAPVRIVELDRAMAALGVTDFVRLGGDGRWRDSGMATDDRGMAVPADDVHADSFWRADLLEAANELVVLIRDRRPQVLITYDEEGLYGHPDHVQAHRVATYAVQLAAVPSYRQDLGEPWQVERVLWMAIPESHMRTMIAGMRESGAGEEFFSSFDLESGEHQGCRRRGADRRLSVCGPAVRRPASARYPDPPGRVLLRHGRLAGRAAVVECYRLAAGTPFPPGADDLFTGLTVETGDRVGAVSGQ